MSKQVKVVVAGWFEFFADGFMSLLSESLKRGMPRDLHNELWQDTIGHAKSHAIFAVTEPDLKKFMKYIAEEADEHEMSEEDGSQEEGSE